MLAAAQYLLCVVAGLMFVAGGVAKLARLDRFREAVSGYRLLPAPAEPAAALALPVAELAAGLALLLPGWAAGPLAGAALFALFAGAIAINLLRGRHDVDCGCNPGAPPQPITWRLVLRNLALAALLIACLLPTAPAPHGALPMVALGGAILWGVTRVFATLGQLARPISPVTYRRV